MPTTTTCKVNYFRSMRRQRKNKRDNFILFYARFDRETTNEKRKATVAKRLFQYQLDD